MYIVVSPKSCHMLGNCSILRPAKLLLALLTTGNIDPANAVFWGSFFLVGVFFDNIVMF